MNTARFFLTNTSGIKLECRIDRDLARKKQSVVIHAMGSYSDCFQSTVQPFLTNIFAAHGFASMRINYRGHGNSEGDSGFITTTSGLEDIQTAIDYLKTLDWVDGIAACGVSYGGGLLLHTIASGKDTYKFLILLSPLIDMQHRFDKDPSVDVKQWAKDGFYEVEYDTGIKRRDYSLYADAANYTPWTDAEKIKIPTIIIHGNKDETVPYEQATKLNKIIKQSQLETLEGVGHRYSGHTDKIKIILDDFLKTKK